ncbi:hypothetical protein BDB00DRAFT_795963 [Zychaea mexicana]|uniref:uncharacterized protein n=1 Tax=Zychaea mexicana TaxID=64656 RepID=UPI0022FDC28F|nr:uncharacterized protein BDB00DRAFT_795963 [Zychaea mexicana]KAI9499234.1 hypothetical protein BDB00DRAFT_795963 [Zychaea mexicana]
MPALDLKGCLEDSPTFRKRVVAHEENIQNFESSLKSLLKLSRAQVNLSSEYSLRQQELALGFLTFGQSQDDPIVAHALEKFGKSMLEVEKCRHMFNSHVATTFIEPLEKFMRDTLSPVKDVRKRFEKSSDDVDSALSKYMSKKPRDPMIPEAANELADTRKGFHQVYMDYVQTLNDVEARKKVDYMENVLAYMYTESVFHHQSYEILKDLEPYMRDLTGLIHDSRQRYVEESVESRNYQDTCAQNAASEYSPMHGISPGSPLAPTHPPSSSSVSKSGYLFERRGGRVLQSWVRKYFIIEGEELKCTYRGPKQPKDDDLPTSYNLRVCSVKLTDGYDRRFCFEVISPSRILVLQAENDQDMHEWVNRLRMANQMALNSDNAMPEPATSGTSDSSPKSKLKEFSSTNSETDQQLLKTLREEPGNNLCADCGTSGPEWASTNLGVIVCIECSGIHRSLGVHVSKVRSLALDKWESETIEIMLRLGNTVANEIFQERIPQDMGTFRIHQDSTRPERDLWITEKYVKRSFVARKTEDEAVLNQEFWDAITESRLTDALRYLAQGAKVDYKNPNQEGQTALHKAVEQGDEIAVEFLLQWFSDVNQSDAKGWSSLHYAAANNNVRLVLALLKRYAKADARDESGKAPLDLAVDRQNVQAVTALRLFAFDKQHNSSPANSLDFGFREAMSSFKLDRSSYGSSHSALDLRQTTSEFSPNEKDIVLNDDQNHNLLHPPGSGAGSGDGSSSDSNI